MTDVFVFFLIFFLLMLAIGIVLGLMGRDFVQLVRRIHSVFDRDRQHERRGGKR